MAKRRTARFEVPFTMETPRLTSPQHGIERVVVNSGDTCERAATILDAPDHRLLRAGIMLAHRVVNGLGDWYLDAPGWGPWLPTDHAEPLGAAGDLPADLAELVRPFRRLATLGPIAAVTTQRTSYSLKDAEDTTLATVRDEATQVQRNGLTISRFREVAITPSAAMTGAQRRFLAEAMRGVGGIDVDDFPQLVQRLGAPATGLTDFPPPREWDSRASLETFVSSLFASRLQDILRADLALRASTLARVPDEDGTLPPDPGAAPLLSELAQLRHQLTSLATVLEPSWRERVVADVDAVLDRGPEQSVMSLDDRYYLVIDALISAVRAPQLGNRSHEQAAPVLRHQLVQGLRILVDRCDRLTPPKNDAPSDDAEWEAALVAARQLLGTTEGIGILFGKLARKVAKQLRKTSHLLDACQPVQSWPDAATMAAWTPTEAFEAGRALQRAGDERDTARARFVEDWPGVRAKLVALRVGG